MGSAVGMAFLRTAELAPYVLLYILTGWVHWQEPVMSLLTG